MYERYRLILSHDMMYEDGSKVELERPITVQYVIDRRDSVPQTVVVNELIRRMEEFVMKEIRDER